MTMPKNDDLGVWKRLMQLGGIGAAELISMRHHDLKTIQLDLGHLRQLAAEIDVVAIPVDRRHGRKPLQLDEQIIASDIAAVQDVIDFAEDLKYLRPQQTMRIREDAESHG